jgi:hypothetical protein
VCGTAGDSSNISNAPNDSMREFETSKLENNMSKSNGRASVIETRPVLGTLVLFRNYCWLNFVINLVIRVIRNYINKSKM